MILAAIENFVLFSTLFAIGGFLVALGLRRVKATGSSLIRPESLARLYSLTIVGPQLVALWLISAVFLPRLWLPAETFVAAHSAPYHQFHLLGELTISLEPALSYALFLFVIVTGAFAVWSNVVGSWRIGRVIGRLEMNATPPSAESVKLVNEIAAQRNLSVGLVMTDYPLSFVWGVRRSKVILSSGLLRTLNSQELVGVLEHETAHHERRDNLFKLLLSLCSYASLAFPLSRVILTWRAAEVEVICDEAAVAHTSEPLELAEALVKLRRQTNSTQTVATSALVSGFLSGNSLTFQYRVDRLLELDSRDKLRTFQSQTQSTRVLGSILIGALLTLLGIFVFAPLSVHHAAETLIEILK